MRLLIITLFLLIPGYVYSQPVNIYVYSAGVGVPANAIYSPFFGAGNVNVTNGGPIANYAPYDIVIFNAWGAGFSAANVASLVTYIQGGGHVVLSTEGAGVAGGGRFMSSVWNALTGQAITETGAGASGTGSPPRFHNSNGPWHLSPDVNLTGSTTSYASFANLYPLNVTHQRNLGVPSCGNIEGLSATFPARPNLGDGTLYIQGEIQYPYGNYQNSAQVTTHASALAEMHFALVTNNQQLLTQLNTWDANLVVDDNFIGNDTSICKTDFIPFIKTCPPYASYSWEDLQGNVLATSANYTIIDSGTYLIRTTGTFPQCDGLDTLHVKFKSNPFSSFTVNSVCEGEQNVFSNTSTIDAPGVNLSTLWDFGDGNADNGMSPSHLYTTSGTYNVQLTSTSDENCVDDTIVSVVVNAKPIANFSIVDDCLYNNPAFTESSIVSSGVIASWNWNFGDVLPSTTVQSTDQVPTYVYTQDGSYDITLIVITDNGCNDTIVQSTNRYPVPQVSFTSVPACKNDSVLFTNTSMINAPDNITSWVWNYGDGSALVSQFEKNHKYLQDGYFNVTLIASSNNGCVSDVTNFTQVYPLPVAEFSNTTTCENGGMTNFFNSSTISQGSIITYSWDFDDNGIVSNSQFASYDYSLAGIYDVELAIETADGCKDTVNHNVEVTPKPEANFIANIKEECFPYCTQFQDNSQSNATSVTDYFWIFGNGQVETMQNPEVCFENISHVDDAVYDVSLIVTNDVGCKDTIVETNYITVWPKPLAEFVVDPSETDMYNSLINFQNLSEGGDSYFWNYGDGVQSSLFEDVHQYADTGVFIPQLIVVTNNDCRDTADLEVKIKAVLNVYVPSAFTPNGDGVNDSFFVEGFAIDFNNFEFLIFDRWGTLMYRTIENKAWDGTYKGELAPQDVYVYRIRLRGLGDKKDNEYEGHFSLLK